MTTKTRTTHDYFQDEDGMSNTKKWTDLIKIVTKGGLKVLQITKYLAEKNGAYLSNHG